MFGTTAPNVRYGLNSNRKYHFTEGTFFKIFPSKTDPKIFFFFVFIVV